MSIPHVAVEMISTNHFVVTMFTLKSLYKIKKIDFQMRSITIELIIWIKGLKLTDRGNFETVESEYFFDRMDHF